MNCDEVNLYPSFCQGIGCRGSDPLRPTGAQVRDNERQSLFWPLAHLWHRTRTQMHECQAVVTWLINIAWWTPSLSPLRDSM